MLQKPLLFPTAIDMKDTSENWCVYIIQCSDNSLYTGISNDVDRRFYQHLNQQGAKYFRGRQPDALVYVENGHNRKTASQREFVIKKLSRPKKLQLIASAIHEFDCINPFCPIE